jgi:hypothetical protein
LQHYNTLIELSNSEKYGLNPVQYKERKQKADELIEDINRLIDDK